MRRAASWIARVCGVVALLSAVLVGLVGPAGVVGIAGAESAGAPPSVGYPIVGQSTSVGQGAFGDVSCPDLADCVAVGTDVYVSGSAVVGVESGGKWTSGELPNGLLAGVQAVSCAADGNCVAVGGISSGNPVAWSLDAGTWSYASLPLPAGTTQGLLTGVSCPAATSCVAVGYAITSNTGGKSILVETLAGGTWTASSPTLPGNGMDAVDCFAMGSCQAVGSGGTAPDNDVYAYTLAGGAWTDTDITTMDVGSTRFSAISCPDVGDCLAVGGLAVGGQSVQEVGGTWSTASFPTPGIPLQLTGVSCVAPQECVATGTDQQGGSFVANVSDDQWAATPVSGAYIDAISCPSQFDCMTAGVVSSINFLGFGLTNVTYSPSVWPVTVPTQGYVLAAADGGIFTFGDARFYGSVAARPSTGRSWAWP